MGILICYIAAAAIELEKWSGNNLGTRYRVWPSWGWICAIVAGALWWFVGSFAACESSLCFSLFCSSDSVSCAITMGVRWWLVGSFPACLSSSLLSLSKHRMSTHTIMRQPRNVEIRCYLACAPLCVSSQYALLHLSKART